jgi:hypothetical protein
MPDWPKPPVFRPFSRWFTSERDRERKELRGMYDHVASRQDEAPRRKDLVARVTSYPVPDAIYRPLEKVIDGLATQHTYMFELPPWKESMSLVEEADLRNFLLQKQHFLENREGYLDRLHTGLVAVWMDFAAGIPELKVPSPFTIPIANVIPKVKELIGYNYWRFLDDKYFKHALFRQFIHVLNQNIARASGIDYEKMPETAPGRLKWPDESQLPVAEWTKVYWDRTPFKEFFEAKVPLKLTNEERFNHWHILGGTGAGKTTLLENLILHDLKGEWPTPSLVVVDGHGDLIRKILRYDNAFNPKGGRHTDQLILVSPKDTKYPPAINIFDVNRARHREYDESTREQVTAGVIQTFDYIFAGLLGADLTAKQGVFFKYVARLMLAMPGAMGRNATILDMMRLMEDSKPYQKAIDSLDDIPRAFFERDFNKLGNGGFTQTKEQIRYRIQAIIENPTMARLFTNERSRIDFFDAINRSSVILVDTAKDFLKGASANFGKVIISLVLQAVMERAAIPEKQRRPVYLIIDEAAEYFDSNIDDLLTEARKYKCGIILAHQYLEQASTGLRASLAANTGIKFAAGVSNADARAMAPNMRTTPEFILDQPQLSFAAHIRNVTQQAVSIPVEIGRFEKEERMSDPDMKLLMAINRERTSFGPPVIAEPNGPPTPGAKSNPRTVAPAAPEDISDEW